MLTYIYFLLGEIPIDHQQPLGAVPQQQRPDAMGMIVDTGANAFASGANALYWYVTHC